MGALLRISSWRQGVAGSAVPFNSAGVLCGSRLAARICRRSCIAAELDRLGVIALEYFQSAARTRGSHPVGAAPRSPWCATMNVSVCIATYRRCERLSALLDDLVKQQVLPTEVIVVDNDAT